MAVQSGRGQPAPPAREAGPSRQVDSDGATPTLVGRDDELAAVVDALGSPPALVLVEGEAGIGKTRLLRETLAAPSLAERRILVAACPPLAEPFPLGAIVTGLRRMRPDVAGLSQSRPGLSALCGALRPMFPEWASDLPPALEPLDDPKETRQRVFAALTELVERLEVDVLVVEDAHWADTATLEWLLTLTADEPAPGDRAMSAPRMSAPRMSLVVTYRPHDVPDGSLLLRLTSRTLPQWSRRRVELSLLDVEQTRELVGSMLGTDEVSEEFGSFLHERTDGLPLALEETIRLMWERHDIIRQDGSWSRRVLGQLRVPPTVRDSVLERFARLGAAARAVLEAAAVLASPCDVELLVTVAGLDDDAGAKGVSDALASGLLQETDPARMVFRHVLDAQAVQEAIPSLERRELHRRAARALQGVEPEPIVRLARHCREAGDTEAWCRYAEASADLARTAGDDQTAVRTLLELLTTVDHPVERRARLAHKVGDAAFFGTAALGDLLARVVDALRDVLAVDGLGRGQRGEIRLMVGRLLWELGDVRSAYSEIEAAVPDLEDRPNLAARAMVTLAAPVEPDWPAARHLAWLERASEQAPRVSSPVARLALAGNRVTALLSLGEKSGWDAAADLPRPSLDSPEQQVIAIGWALNLAELATMWGRYEVARKKLEVAKKLIAATESQRDVSGTRVVEAFLGWYTGSWEGLAEVAAELIDSDQSRPKDQQHAQQICGLLDHVTGDRVKAERCLREVVASNDRWGVFGLMALPAPAALGRLALADGSADAALLVTRPVVEMVARKGVWVWAADIAPVHVEALVGAGSVAEAEEWVAAFADGIVGRDSPTAEASLLVCKGVLEAQREPLSAASLFGDAVAAWAALPRPYDEFLARERQGRCLLAAGVEDEGVAMLSDAQQRLHDLGAKWDADRVAHVLRQHGVEVVRTWRRGPQGYGDQLSPRELEVVELAARGMTNKQIAETLYISHRTVGQHLSGAMRKLEVSSRTALVMAASQAGLLATTLDDKV